MAGAPLQAVPLRLSDQVLDWVSIWDAKGAGSRSRRGRADRIARLGPNILAKARVGAVPMAMSEESNIRFVRSIWEAIREGGIEAGFELTPGVEWQPHAAGGLVLTTEELLKFLRRVPGRARAARGGALLRIHAHGDYVLASGSFRLRGPGRISEFQIHLVYEFEDDRLRAGQRPTPRAPRRSRRSASTSFDAAVHARWPPLRGSLPHLRLSEGPTPGAPPRRAAARTPAARYGSRTTAPMARSTAGTRSESWSGSFPTCAHGAGGRS